MRIDEEHIITVEDKNVKYVFANSTKMDEDNKHLLLSILQTYKAKQRIITDLMEQLNRELTLTCRTELVHHVFITITDIYKTDDGKDINVSFYTEYVVKIDKDDSGCMNDVHHGFYCDNTLGRYSIKNREFYEISNSMISNCKLL